MCGRFTLRASAKEIAEQFAVSEPSEWKLRFNVAPTQMVAAVRISEATSKRELVWLRWGLIPSWAKDATIGNRLINARAETVAEKPAFRSAFRRQRCLISADGFYEWLQEGKRKTPFYFQRKDGRLFAFAGLWESWEGPDHGVIESCTLITTAANEVVRPIHDRMPAIISPADYRWLDPTKSRPEQLLPLLRPYADELVVNRVGSTVNRPSNDLPACVEPV